MMVYGVVMCRMSYAPRMQICYFVFLAVTTLCKTLRTCFDVRLELCDCDKRPKSVGI